MKKEKKLFNYMNIIQIKKDDKKYFIIINNNNIRKNLQSNSLKSIHFDTNYKCIPPTPQKLRLLVVSGFD